MYNYFMLIGVIYKDIELKVAKNGVNYARISLLVNRPFKNVNGEYDADFFQIYLWDALSEIAIENFKKGTKIGIKGRIQTRFQEGENNVKIPAYDLISERLIFFDNKNYEKEFNNMTIEPTCEE